MPAPLPAALAQVPRPAAPAHGSGDGRPVDGKRFVTLNVGGHRFLTTAATLAAVDGSYFCKLAQQASQQAGGRGGASAEFFVDRSGKVCGRGGAGWGGCGGGGGGVRAALGVAGAPGHQAPALCCPCGCACKRALAAHPWARVLLLHCAPHARKPVGLCAMAKPRPLHPAALQIFEYVLDHLRSRRFGDSPSTLPKDERTLTLLARWGVLQAVLVHAHLLASSCMRCRCCRRCWRSCVA